MDNEEFDNLAPESFVAAVFIGRGITRDERKATFMPGVYPGKDITEGGEWKPVELRHGDLVPVPTDPSLYANAVASGQFAQEAWHEKIAAWLEEGKSGTEIYELVKAEGGLLS